MPTWRLIRDLRIPAESEGLERVYTMVVTPKGSIAVVDNANLKLSIYDSTGRRIARVGGKGTGPGELQYVNQEVHGIVGDSVWFYDWTSRRLVVYTAQGKHGRTSALTGSPTGPLGTLRGQPIALLADGSMVMEGTFASSTRESMARANRAVVVSRLGAIVRVLGRFDPPVASVSAVTRTSTSSLTIPFVSRSLTSASSNGGFVLFVAPSDRAGMRDTVRVSVVRNTGDTAYSLTQVLSRARIPDSIYQKARDMQLSSARRKGTESQVRETFLKLLPRSYPAVEGTFVTREGRAWLRLHPKVCDVAWPSVCQGATSYLVISPAGKPEAMVAVPASVRLEDAYGDRAWGFEEDEDGFRNPVRFRIHR